MSADKKTLLIPILLIATGAGWLLTSLGVVPQVDWVWTLGLAAVGVLAFLIAGIDKVSVVVGPFFILASFLSFFRQTSRMDTNMEVPILVIAAGVLLFVARVRSISAPGWLIDTGEAPRK